jgi:hypothetical protein
MNAPVKIPAGVQIAQALHEAIYPHGRLLNHSETQWNSATFSGARHAFTIRFDGPGSHTFAEALIEQICNDDITIRGHLVADITAPGQRFASAPECYAEVDVAALTLAN